MCGGTTHDALTLRRSTSLPTYIRDGRVDLMDYEVAQGRTSEKEGTVVILLERGNVNCYG